MSNPQFAAVLCTVPDENTATRIARALVEGGLAACCNVVPGLRSVYMWKGEVCDDAELLLIIKTRLDRFGELEAAVRDLHPYDVPELIALPVARGSADYLTWMADHVHPAQ